MPGSAVLVGLLCPLLLWSARAYSPATPYQRRVSWRYRTGAGGPSGPVSSLTWAHVSMRLSAGEGEARQGHSGGSRAKGSGVSRRQQQQQQVGVLAGSVVGAWCWGVGAGRAGAKAAVQAPSAYYPQVLQGQTPHTTHDHLVAYLSPCWRSSPGLAPHVVCVCALCVCWGGQATAPCGR